MLLFSTLLDISQSMKKEDFIRLIVEWNQSSEHEENIIRDVVWDGKSDDIRFGDEKVWLHIVNSDELGITAARFNKTDENDGIIWTTDYVMNFNDMKMAVRLDRSYKEENLLLYSPFSTPHFITLLIEHGYLEDDHGLQVSRRPLLITEENLDILCDVINGNARYSLPVVYVSRTYYDEDPVDVGRMAARLKGVAHVFSERQMFLDKAIKEKCKSRNEYYGAVGIYYPNDVMGHRRFLYHAQSGPDDSLMDKVIRNVMEYSNSQLLDSLYTWQGVNNAMLTLHLSKAQEEKQKAENEVDALYGAFDRDFEKLRSQLEELLNIKMAYEAEIQGLRNKLSSKDAEPLVYMGEEEELFPGEIKEFVMDAVNTALKNTKEDTRRYHALKDIQDQNDYPHELAEKRERLKTLMNGYKTMSSTLRQELISMGFTITEEGKHYKLVYHNDPRYCTTISKSGSDHREGKNIVTKICKEMM